MKNGVHSVALYIDSTLYFSESIDHFAFADTRYVNSLLDYPLLIKSNYRIQRSFVAPNNKLKIYRALKNRGMVSFTDDKTHKVFYRVKDDAGNTSGLTFWVKSEPPVNSAGNLPGLHPERYFHARRKTCLNGRMSG